MAEKEAARRSCSYGTRQASNGKPDADIVRDYERGCKWFALIFAAMWAAIMAMEVFA